MIQSSVVDLVNLIEHRRSRTLATRVLWAAASTAAFDASAAGGHHAIDDATLLGPHQCQLETWVERETGGSRRLTHAGPACRVGPVELGLNVDRSRESDGQSTIRWSPQLKWAMAIGAGWSTGFVTWVAAQDHAPHVSGATMVALLTWEPADAVRLHANAGRDLRRGEPDTSRAGLALDWVPHERWTLVAERFRENGANHWRAGARWAATPAISIDVSHARAIGQGPPAWWTLGLTWAI